MGFPLDTTCQWHKRENVVSYLSKGEQASYAPGRCIDAVRRARSLRRGALNLDLRKRRKRR